jgi:spore coat polysaccharide biosynthesis protein SpsF
MAGKTMLEHVVERVSAAWLVDQVVIATTTDPSDDVLHEFCAERGWSVVRGSMEDVLSRFVLAAERFRADIIVRVTTDCPLADPELIDDVVRVVMSSDYDYVSNRLPPDERTIPLGLDVECFRRSALEGAATNAADGPEREHVTPYIYHNREKFRCMHLRYPEIGEPDFRLTVDTQADFELISRILVDRSSFSWKSILNRPLFYEPSED